MTRVAATTVALAVCLALAVSPAFGAVCGDGVCDESCRTCSTDCGPCQENTIATRCVNPHQFAFTFDDGPSPLTPSLLDILQEEGIKIGFFQIGQNIDSYPEHSKRAMEEGHFMASHSYSHPSLPTLSAAEVRREMQETEASMMAATGCFRPRLMRPPYGEIDGAVSQVLWDMGYIPVNWNADTNDWQGWDALAQAEAALSSLNPTSIVLLQHDLYQPSINDVPAIAAAVKSYGYEIVRIDECIYGTTMTSSRVWQTALCGAPVCGDKKCDPTETCSTCSGDCGVCPPTCGDKVCAATESCSTCSSDCGACPASCGDKVCQSTETCSSCPGDCGICPSTCGDKVCQSTESCSTCAGDCGACPGICGDSICQSTETCATCAADCCTSGTSIFTGPLTTDGTCGSNNANNAICPAGQCCSKYGWCGTGTSYCTGSSVSTGVPVICGDKTCNSVAGESCSNCPQDCVCANPCGDGTCATGETCTSCPADCGSCPVTPVTPVCGDAQCNGAETCTSCPGDCGPCQTTGAVTTCVSAKDYALTFDAGPTANTPALLDILKTKKARATFFLSGQLAGAAGMGAVVQRIVNEGHLIGARSYDDLDFTTQTNDNIRSKLAQADAVIQSVSCQRPRLLRPPLGKFTDAQRTFLESLGYKLVTWNLDTLDGSATTAAQVQTTVNTFLATKPTSVIHLQHDKATYSVNAVSGIIDAIVAAGYNLVTLDQCVYGHAASSYRDYQVSKCTAFCGDYSCSTSESCTTCSMDCGVCAARCGDGVCGTGETCTTCCADCGACATRPTSTDGKCGTNSATNAVCPTGKCCSQYGWCGTGTAYCTGSSDTGASGCTTTTAVCGDKVCAASETCTSCPGDCGTCAAVCGDKTCNGQETCSSCPGDCGVCAAVCGNGKCETGETCTSCASDCGACPAVCGNAKCETGETCVTCAADCGACPATCGDKVCASTETCTSCPGDCGACPATCGDKVCASTESCTTCPGDCGACPPVCGDKTCAAGETCTTCPGDCGACPPVCGDKTCSTGETCASCPGDCGTCTATGTCSGCWGHSSGPCKSVIGVCYPFGADGKCVAGTSACTLAATVGLASAADAVVVTLEVSSPAANVTTNDLNSQARAILVQQVATAAGVSADSVLLAASVDQLPMYRTGSIDRTDPATSKVTSAVVAQFIISGSSGVTSADVRAAVLKSNVATDLSSALGTTAELAPVSEASARNAGAPAYSMSGAASSVPPSTSASPALLASLLAVAGVLVLASIAAIVYIRRSNGRASLADAVSPTETGGRVFNTRASPR